jgi:hypothetical protein
MRVCSTFQRFFRMAEGGVEVDEVQDERAEAAVSNLREAATGEMICSVAEADEIALRACSLDL